MNIQEDNLIPSGARLRDPAAVRSDILKIATEEFASHGLSGARVDAIAARTRTSKRMIYYYFGSKEGLFVAVLEAAYRDIRTIESGLDLEKTPPLEALRKLAEFTFDYQFEHPDFIRLVMAANMNGGAHLDALQATRNINESAIRVIDDICRRGVADGSIRPDVAPLQIHMTISALSFFNVSNEASFSRIHAMDMRSPEAHSVRRAIVGDTIVRYAKAG